MAKPLALTGQQFSRLLVIRLSDQLLGKNRSRAWVCRCDCGKETLTATADLTRGHKRSCGCLQKDVVSPNFKTHGLTGTPEHKAWLAMLARCSATSEINPDYAGRGIAVCDRWKDFLPFLEDMGERPPKTTLDRINNDGNYEPRNCRWATREQQESNKRTSVFITFDSKTMTLSQWGRELNTDPSVLRQRYRKFGTLNPITRSKESYCAKKNRA
jgi:hypothetical protein